MLLSPRKSGLTSLFKEVRVVKDGHGDHDRISIYKKHPWRRPIKVDINFLARLPLGEPRVSLFLH